MNTRNFAQRLVILTVLGLLAACGGGSSAPVVPPALAAITAQPAPQTITAGQNASFSVTAAGTALTYQWQHSMDGGSTFTDEAGATAATLTLTAVAQLHNGHFLRVVVSNSAGSVTSNAALLTVNAAAIAPSFTTQPANVTVTAGQNAQLTVAVAGSPTPSLQWQLSTDSGVNWSNINGATNTVFDIIAPSIANNGRQFRAVASNSSGSVDSSAATLTVTAAVTYTVGGTVNGLAAGASMVLQDNGGNNLAVSANGAYTFTTSLANNAAYAVTVLTQPALQTCTIANASGTVSAANITNVAVTCVVSIALPKTGQTTCYDATNAVTACAGTGQDGDVQKGVAVAAPRFVVGSGATASCITDSLTGLMWVRVPSVTGDTWANALIAANNLNLCGFTDWRLPNLVELGSLLNYSVADNATVLNAAGFSIGSWHWTSTTNVSNPVWAGALSIADGQMTASANKIFTYPRTLPVRGP